MPIEFDTSKFHVVDISDQIKVAVPPTWHITQTSEHYGRDLRDLENEVARELGIEWGEVFGEAMQGVYENPTNCARVVVGMVRKRPELELWVTCSDPEFSPMYRPLAHVEIKPTLSFE